MAARRLAYLGATAPVEIAIEALDYAQLHGFSEMDMRQMANLITALRLYTPVPQAPTPFATSGVEQTLVPLPSAGTLTP
jgi:hypothetical protein